MTETLKAVAGEELAQRYRGWLQFGIYAKPAVEMVAKRCGDLIIGHDAPSDHARGRVRWSYATWHWDRKALGCYGY